MQKELKSKAALASLESFRFHRRASFDDQMVVGVNVREQMTQEVGGGVEMTVGSKELAGADSIREHRLHSFQDDDRAWRKGEIMVVLM